MELVLDKVSGLGHFLELEYAGKSVKDINLKFDKIVNSLGLSRNQIISGCGYPDLLMDKKRG